MRAPTIRALGLSRPPTLCTLTPRLQRQLARSRTYQTAVDDSVRLHNVRFKRTPVFTRRRLMRTFLWSSAVYVLLRTLVLPHIAIEIQEVSEEEQDGVKKDGPGSGIEVTDEEQEMEEGDIFIPFTRAVELPRKYYRGSDPEWQEFIKIAQDKSKQTQLCEQLKTTLLKKVPGRLNLHKPLGNNIECGKHWIDFIFPDGPPPEHSREGLVVGNGRLAWGSEVVDDATYRRQSRLVWPKEAIDSVLFSGRILLELGYEGIMSVMGYKIDSKSQYAKDLAQVRNAAKFYQLQALKQESADDGSGNAAESFAKSRPPQSESSRPWPLSAFTSSGLSITPWTDADQKPPSQLALLTWSTFTLGYMKSEKSQKREPPRGTFIMHGLIELRGTRGRMLFDVRAVYDPRTEAFVDLAATLRNYKQWAQKPKGGD